VCGNGLVVLGALAWSGTLYRNKFTRGQRRLGPGLGMIRIERYDLNGLEFRGTLIIGGTTNLRLGTDPWWTYPQPIIFQTGHDRPNIFEKRRITSPEAAPYPATQAN